jgi:hypothetical protein
MSKEKVPKPRILRRRKELNEIEQIQVCRPPPPCHYPCLTPRRSGAHHAAGAGTRQQPTGIRQVRRHRRNCGICRCAPLRRAAAVVQDPKRPKKSKLCHYDGCAARDHTSRSCGPGRDGQRKNRYRNSLLKPPTRSSHQLQDPARLSPSSYPCSSLCTARGGAPPTASAPSSSRPPASCPCRSSTCSGARCRQRYDISCAL